MEIKLHGEYAVKDEGLYKRAIVVSDRRYTRHPYTYRFMESASGEYILVDLFNHGAAAKPTRGYFQPSAFVATWADFTASEARHAESEAARLNAARVALHAVGVEHSVNPNVLGPVVVLTLEQAEALVRKLGVLSSFADELLSGQLDSCVPPRNCGYLSCACTLLRQD